MDIQAQLVKQLREKTNVGFMDCKKALKETGGDIKKAEEYLRKAGISVAAKKSGRAAKDGVVASYIHHGDKVGVMVEINCETDFVARNKSFKDFVKDVLLQIASAKPKYVNREEVAPEELEKEAEIIKAQMKGKPDHLIETKILPGRIEKYYQDTCLMDQVFVKSTNDQTITQLLTEKIAEIGENIVIRRFVRFELGEEVE